MKHVALFGFCLVSLIAAQGTLAAKIYTWTDQYGVTHFGEHPPKDVNAILMKTRTGHSQPMPQTPSDEKKTEAVIPKAASKPIKDQEQCDIAKKNLSTLQSAARVKVTDDKGELRYLTEEEKQTKFNENQLIVDENC